MKKISWKKSKPQIFGLNKNFAIGMVEENLQPISFEFPQHELLFPVVEGAENPKEELIYLLKIAAEVEHTLMVQYLYAAYSIKEEDSSELRTTLINIAIQEMGHFLAVQNLILSIGGIENIHLNKSEYRPTSSDNPLPYTLEPITPNLLAKFVAIEAPLDIPLQFKQEVDDIHKIAKGKGGVSLNPVGGLYMKIFWLFQKDDTPVFDLMVLSPSENLKAHWHINDNDFLPESEIEKYEAVYDIWDRSGAMGPPHNITLSQVHKRDDALKLVYQISSQGEGANFDDDIPTHFELFLAAYRNYNPTAQSFFNAPINPITRPNPEFSLPVKIENSYSLLWSSLFNVLYSSLLLDIYSSMFYKQFSIDTTKKFTGIIFTSMRTVITSISNILLKLPLLDNGFNYNSEPRCAATFEVEPNFVLNQEKEKVDLLNKALVSKIRDKVNLIKAHSDFQKHLDADGLEERPIVSFSLTQAENYCLRKSQLLPIINLT